MATRAFRASNILYLLPSTTLALAAFLSLTQFGAPKASSVLLRTTLMSTPMYQTVIMSLMKPSDGGLHVVIHDNLFEYHDRDGQRLSNLSAPSHFPPNVEAVTLYWQSSRDPLSGVSVWPDSVVSLTIIVKDTIDLGAVYDMLLRILHQGPLSQLTSFGLSWAGSITSREKLEDFSKLIAQVIDAQTNLKALQISGDFAVPGSSAWMSIASLSHLTDLTVQQRNGANAPLTPCLWPEQAAFAPLRYFRVRDSLAYCKNILAYLPCAPEELQIIAPALRFRKELQELVEEIPLRLPSLQILAITIETDDTIEGDVGYLDFSPLNRCNKLQSFSFAHPFIVDEEIYAWPRVDNLFLNADPRIFRSDFLDQDVLPHIDLPITLNFDDFYGGIQETERDAHDSTYGSSRLS